MTIATLIAAGRLDERLLRGALDRLPDARLLQWVDEGDAADLSSSAAREEIRASLEGWEGVDIIAHPPGPREKRLLVADMDSTMIGQECIDELADYAGVKQQVAGITERAMRGELEFREALAERVSLLKGLHVEVLGQCLAERVRPNPGAETLVRTMASRGAGTLLVSGGFTAFAGPVAGMIGFAGFRANILEVKDGVLTGGLCGPVVDSAAKKTELENLRDEMGAGKDAVIAIGDGANDAPMVEESGLGIAYRAKPVLAAVADARLDHHPLDALLWAQAIPRRLWLAG